MHQIGSTKDSDAWPYFLSTSVIDHTLRIWFEDWKGLGHWGPVLNSIAHQNPILWEHGD